MKFLELLGFKNLWPSFADLNLTKNAVLKSLLVFPKMLSKSIIFIIVFILLELLYFYFLFPAKQLSIVPGNINNILLSLTQSSFSLLQWVFLIFLIPFHLYNHGLKSVNSPKPLLEFKPFLARCVMPAVVDPIRALFVVILYGLAGIAIGSVLIGLYAMSFTFEPALLKYLIIPFLIPAFIKIIHYTFIPFVIFFNKEYIENKKSSLKLSTFVCRGLPVVFLVLGFLPFGTIELLDSLLKTIFYGPNQEVSSINIFYFSLSSLFRIASTIFTSSVLYFMYIEKDKAHLL